MRCADGRADEVLMEVRRGGVRLRGATRFVSRSTSRVDTSVTTVQVAGSLIGSTLRGWFSARYRDTRHPSCSSGRRPFSVSTRMFPRFIR
jgi:hypothetical protein